jgi:hypothetical protein
MELIDGCARVGGRPLSTACKISGDGPRVSMSAEVCLFCTDYVPTDVPPEHVIPRSMGGAGWLITHGVCNSCNSYFGRTVDAIAEAPLFQQLRREAGLDVA